MLRRGTPLPLTNITNRMSCLETWPLPAQWSGATNLKNALGELLSSYLLFLAANAMPGALFLTLIKVQFCHSPTQPQYKLRVTQYWVRTHPTGTFKALPGNLGSWFFTHLEDIWRKTLGSPDRIQPINPNQLAHHHCKFSCLGQVTQQQKHLRQFQAN